jgi:Na+-translocating ferredoxin:NAD+ oxidoreductase subunit G
MSQVETQHPNIEVVVEKQHSDQPRPKQTSSLAMVMTLGIVAMVSGLLVVLTWQLTYGPIKENQRIMIEKAIFQVIPNSTHRQTYTLTDSGLVSESQTKTKKDKTQENTTSTQSKSKKEDLKFYAAFDNKGQLKGVAAEGAAQGYADMVKLLYGYDPACECIRGFSIIKMAETPGLGDKILTDKNFLANFDALDARINSNETALINNIVTVKSGSKKNPWEIDAISGATITSKAVGKAINQSATQLLPRLKSYLKQITFDKKITTSQQVASDSTAAESQQVTGQE